MHVPHVGVWALVAALRGAHQANDRQVPTSATMFDVEIDQDTGSSPNERVGSRSETLLHSLCRARRESIAFARNLAVPQSPLSHFGCET